MVEIVRQRLVELAQAGRWAHYAEVGALVNLNMASPGDRTRLSSVLDSISRDEFRDGRPLLSAVVILSGTNPPMPGNGFFTMARQIGAFTGGSREDAQRFHQAELERVFEHWQNEISV